ncbi:aspartic peptidase domain-containing protein [Scleroderma yunnanense]
MSHIIVRNAPFSADLRVARNGAKELLQHDRARAAKLLSGVSPHGPRAFVESFRRRRDGGETDTSADHPSESAGTPGSVDVTDAGVTYIMSVGVGSPATTYNLLVDTGSSNTWIGAQKAYHPTHTSHSTGNTVHVSYGSGRMTGKEYTDTVALGPNLVIQNQSIGVATDTQGFHDVDGILGIGPVHLTQNTVSNTDQVPTVTDNLSKEGTIHSNSLGIFYEPSSTEGVKNGEITFGGVDHSKITGEISYVPITSTIPAAHYWGIDQTITYGQNTPILGNSAGIVDTGTTLLLLATDVFEAYQEATGAVLDQTTGLLSITQAQYDSLQSLFFNIGEVTYEFTPNAQIWPRALNTTLGGDPDKIYLITSDLQTPSGSGLDFINGFGWLQRFYTVYDTTNARVGIATTSFTDAETN